MSSTESDSSLLLSVPQNEGKEDFEVAELMPEKAKHETLESLSEAIETTERILLESEENSEEHQSLTKKLVELKIKREDLQERLCEKDESGDAAFMIKGHTFISCMDPLADYADILTYWKEGKNKGYCQVCGSGIWSYFQSSQHCRDCGLCAHQSCLPNTKRECIAMKIRTKPNFITQICPEKSLLSLKFECSECKCKLSSQKMDSLPRLCDYTGLYYCPSCHWDSLGITPARIIQNWDFSKQPLCLTSMQYLALMTRKPIIDMEKANSKLFITVQELNEVERFRRNILIMKKYLQDCQDASEKNLLLLLSDRQHFLENKNMYSLQDLIDTNSGELLNYLKDITDKYENHITTDCDHCSAKGFICELCDDKSALYPFYQMAHTCQKCNEVLHRHCFRANSSKCPKCSRTQQKTQEEL